ncbi:hypothetical protein MAR_014916 [Mya arenaria]|uniref:Uncharacterized protein n=1 Tax=Mya arenaria TaxID=6604 RepID=A0ABY7FH62_MYAAR|nr:hypothetical protein MAR_014916 [Mya arenaria]
MDELHNSSVDSSFTCWSFQAGMRLVPGFHLTPSTLSCTDGILTSLEYVDVCLSSRSNLFDATLLILIRAAEQLLL